MKLKGINPFERHAEKAALAFFALFAFAVFVMQLGLFGGGNAVKVGTQTVAPEQAIEAVAAKAREKRAGLERDGPDPAVPDPASIPSIAARFERELHSPVSTTPRLALLGSPDVIVEGGPNIANGPAIPLPKGAVFEAIVPPAAGKPVVSVVEGTIDARTVASVGAELAKLLPSVAPFDVRAISVQATIDAAALRDQFIREREGFSLIPAGWWQDSAQILDVELVRQELGKDGNWGSETVVAAPPGSEVAAMRARLHSESLDPAARRELLQRELTKREAIRRPAFYPMVSGFPWTSPGQAAAVAQTNPNRAVIERLKGELAGVRAKIVRTNKQLTAPPPSQTKPPAGAKPGAPGGAKEKGSSGSGGAPGGFMAASTSSSGAPSTSSSIPASMRSLLASAAPGGSRGTPQKPQKSPEQEKQEKEANLKKIAEETLKRLQAREQELLKELKGLGEDPDKPIADVVAAPPPFVEPLLGVAESSASAITVWSHDLTAQPGKTYRYQVRYWIGNPFFGNADKLADDQRSLAETAALRSSAGEWSDTVTLPPDSVFFVTGASPGSHGVIRGDANAFVEGFRFYYGFWRHGTDNLLLGDQVQVAIELPEFPALDGSEPVKVSPETKSLRLPAFLLDVASEPEASGPIPMTRVYFGNTSGDVAVRWPARDTSDALYAHVSNSAATGAKLLPRNPSTTDSPNGQAPGTQPAQQPEQAPAGQRPSGL
ncbi:MAG TPA: hypothetical protein VG797_10885 [Phycisphaerales bacterium]|nr:hypothetical protein [Phycisphaerales bacterium]